MCKCMKIAAVAAVVLACISGAQANVVMETVSVGNPGNPGELSGAGAGAGGAGADAIVGGVDYVYNIGKYEVTAGQYTEFLNAVADTDTYALYKTNMAGGAGSQIVRTGVSGSYIYSVAPDWADRPVNYTSWGDAARFSNWLHNGQPTGAQGLGTTEDGSYFLNGAASYWALLAVTREDDATWVIPSEDEWYKAAYYKGGGTNAGYWDYATQSDTIPTAEAPPGTDMTNGSANWYNGGYVDPTYWTTEVGAYTAKPSDSAYGTFDQGGNLHEWNEAVIGSQNRGWRGGSFLGGSELLHAAQRHSGLATSEYYTLGFRVAEVPEPTTAALLLMGGLAVLARHRRTEG